jgi:hypothetical protein
MNTLPSFDDDIKPKLTLRNIAIGAGILIAVLFISYGTISFFRTAAPSSEVKGSTTSADAAIVESKSEETEKLEKLEKLEDEVMDSYYHQDEVPTVINSLYVAISDAWSNLWPKKD